MDHGDFGQGGWGGMQHGDFGYGGWGGEALLAGIALPILAFVAVALLGLLLLRARGGLTFGRETFVPPPASPPLADPALVLLRERYARGEIDAAEYDERRHRLVDETATL